MQKYFVFCILAKLMKVYMLRILYLKSKDWRKFFVFRNSSNKIDCQS